ncbi:MAG: 3D domain-containing protein, partial [bacterium]
ALFAVGGTLRFGRRSVVIQADGRVMSLDTRARTIGQALEAARMRVGPKDVVQPPPSHPIEPGMRIRVVRVTDEDLVENIPLPFRRLRREVLRNNLRPVEIRHGTIGVRERVTRIVRMDGRVVARRVVGDHVRLQPTAQVALLDESGRAQRVYDLWRARSIRLRSTAYWPGDPQSGPDNITFLGLNLQRGHVAVDPRVVPLASRLYIPGYGYAYAADTGSAIKGRRIDLAVANAKAAGRWDWRWLNVYILETPGKKWNPRRDRAPLKP